MTMNLTPTQEQKVSKFLREAAASLDQLSPIDRAKQLANVRSRLQGELKRFQDAPPDDSALDAVLDKFRRSLPDSSARDGRRAPQPAEANPLRDGRGKTSPVIDGAAHPESRRSASGLGDPDRVWLGVCLALADRLNVDAFLIRLAFVLFGLVTWPVAILVYMGVYLELYYTSRKEERPAIDYGKVIRRTGAAAAGLAGLYWTKHVAVWGIERVYERLVGDPLVIGEWAWLDPHEDRLLFWVLFISLPLALLSGLPLHGGWDYTWKRVVQAGAAIYAVVISAAIASAVVAALLALVDKFAV